MDMNSYQAQARATAVYLQVLRGVSGLDYTVLGLVGEAGELANKLKKIHRDRGGIVDAISEGELMSELGDVLWYVAMVAKELGRDLDDVAKGNLDKLQGRHERTTLQGSGDHR